MAAIGHLEAINRVSITILCPHPLHALLGSALYEEAQPRETAIEAQLWPSIAHSQAPWGVGGHLRPRSLGTSKAKKAGD